MNTSGFFNCNFLIISILTSGVAVAVKAAMFGLKFNFFINSGICK